MLQGPPIQELTRHLAECPQSFLAEPLQPNGSGEVHVAAVVADLLRALGSPLVTREQVKNFSYSSPLAVRQERNRLRLVLLSCWLCSQAQLLKNLKLESVVAWLSQDGFYDLARLAPVESFLSDPERREELARWCLASNSLLPSGESKQEAENRLDALSTVKRDAVIKEAKLAQERARKVREEMAQKERERQAASVYSNE